MSAPQVKIVVEDDTQITIQESENEVVVKTNPDSHQLLSKDTIRGLSRGLLREVFKAAITVSCLPLESTLLIIGMMWLITAAF